MTAQYPNANTYYIAYFDFLSQSAQAIPSNAFLEYDEYLPFDQADFSGGVDLRAASATCAIVSTTGSYIRDQNYLRAHPFSDQSAYAKGRWYHRKFDMGAAAGQTLTEACLANDTGNSSNGAPSNRAGVITAISPTSSSPTLMAPPWWTSSATPTTLA